MRLLYAIVIAAVMTVAGCSDDDESVDADESAPTSSAAGPTTTATTGAELDPPATSSTATVIPPASVRDALLASGFASEQVDCIITSMALELGLSETELDDIAATERTAAEVSAAGEVASLTCLAPAARPPGSGPGSPSPFDPDGKVVDRMSELGYTSEEASCLGDMIGGDGDVNLPDCLSASRLVEIINS